MEENDIKNEIAQVVAQVDDSLTITEFICTVDKEKRIQGVFFKAENPSGEMVEIRNNWG